MAEPRVPRLELPFFAPDWTELKASSNGLRDANEPDRLAGHVAAAQFGIFN